MFWVIGAREACDASVAGDECVVGVFRAGAGLGEEEEMDTLQQGGKRVIHHMEVVVSPPWIP
jgi:hypothetical protein